jgi:deoxyribose-phosphate aldolase
MSNISIQNFDVLLKDAVERVTRELAAAPSDEAEADLSPEEIAHLIDHTLLKPEVIASQIRTVCQEALTYNFASVCVNPTWIPLCAELLAGSDVNPCATIGFPLGAMTTASKAFEAADAVSLGAPEVDMVINVGRLRDGEWEMVFNDIATVAEVVHGGGALLKVILETCLLTDEEKIAGSLLTKLAGADFVKTSTGFNTGGATIHDIRLMRATVGPDMGVKAAGGIHSAADVRRMVAAGATRIGASAGVQIMQSLAGMEPDAIADGDY